MSSHISLLRLLSPAQLRALLGALVLLLFAGTAATTAYAQSAGAVAPHAVTFDKVVEYVNLEVSEAKILRLIDSSPTKFVLGEDQVRILREAGASPAILEAMQKQGQVVAPSSDVTDFVLILDASGSMNDRLADGSSKWQAAQRAAADLVRSVPEGRKLSLIVYGRDAQRKCQAIDVVKPLSVLERNDKQELVRYLEALKAVGHTPIANSLKVAGRELEASTGLASIVLITDGMESCHGDPAAEAARLLARFPNLRGGINVIGFCLGDKEARQVEAIAKAGHGEYYDAQTAGELVASVRKVERAVIKAPVVEVVVEEVNLEAISPIVRLLIEQLSDRDIDVRKAAASALRDRKAVEAVPALTKLILKGEIDTGLWWDADRDEAIKTIVALAPQKAAGVLAAMLQNESGKLRTWAAEAVADHKVTDALPAVEARLLSLTDNDVTNYAINGAVEPNALLDALQKLTPDRMGPMLVQVIRNNRSANAKVWATEKLRYVK